MSENVQAKDLPKDSVVQATIDGKVQIFLKNRANSAATEKYGVPVYRWSHAGSSAKLRNAQIQALLDHGAKVVATPTAEETEVVYMSSSTPKSVPLADVALAPPPYFDAPVTETDDNNYEEEDYDDEELKEED